MDEEALNLIDYYLGDYIDRVVRKYRYNVDLEEEYPELLKYIYRRLVKAWFNGRKPSTRELEEALKAVRSGKKRLLEIFLSYIISRYAARHGHIYVRRSDWGGEEQY